MSVQEEDNWETDEVIKFLINDEGCYSELLDASADEIEAFVRENTLTDLYKSFEIEHASFDDVDWTAVAAALA